MKVEVNITADPRLIECIENITGAIAGLSAQKAGSVVNIKQRSVEDSNTWQETQADTQAEAPAEAPAEKQMKPADIKKAELCEKIIALGGTPPKVGHVKKFEDALEALELAAAATEAEESEDEDLMGLGAEEPPVGVKDEIDIDELRANTVKLAQALLKAKNTPADPKAGQNMFRATMTLAGAKMLSGPTGATREQLADIIPGLEAHLGRTMADVLAETAE